MHIPVVVKDGTERLVSKEELQQLLVTRQVLFFKRSDGWIVIGRDEIRNQRIERKNEGRRQPGGFYKGYWY